MVKPFQVPLAQYRLAVGLLLLLVMGLSACNGESKPGRGSDFDAYESVNIGGDGDIFAPDRLIEVEITLPARQFERLKAEGRTLARGARDACYPDYDYTRFPATVTIDGDTLDKVNIRKKGFIGSLSLDRPSLILYFDDLHKGRTYQHRDRMTLNNNRQDASNVRQCMAYDLFREAGLPAPRCNFARVTVNGEDMGIYSHVEPLRRPFLRRVFGSDQGNQYESQTGDFGLYLSQNLQKKNFKRENDRSDVAAVDAALQLDDAGLVEALPQLVDVDQFIRFWAMETLLGLWDSATGNANNFHIYHNPQDQRFHFIPWGADTTFSRGHPLKPGSGPLFRNFSLAARMYEIEQWREQYEATLHHYLDTLWDEEALLAEVARIRALTGTTEAAQRQVIAFIQGREATEDSEAVKSQRELIQGLLSGEEPDGTVHLLPDEPMDCSQPRTTALTGTVTSQGGPNAGAFRFTRPNGALANASLYFASFEVDPLIYALDEIPQPPVIGLTLIGADVNDAFTPYVLQMFIESPQFTDGQHRLHGIATNVLLFAVDRDAPNEVEILAVGADGTFTLSGTDSFLEQGGDGNDLSLTFDLNLEYVPRPQSE